MTYPSPNLDVLRSLAVIFVVASHLLLDRSAVGVGIYHAQTLGTLGVMIFFVHTCLVLMLSLERQAKLYETGPSTIAFLVGRVFRIYPLSIVVVVLIAAFEAGYGAPSSTFSILSNIFLIQNLTGSRSITPVLWSLPFEFQMYFFLPALYGLIRYSGRSSASCILALWGALIALVWVFWRFGVDSSLIKFFPCFLPGVLAFCLRDSPRQFPPKVLFAYACVLAIVYPSLVGYGASATVLSWLICLSLGVLIPRCREIRSGWLCVSSSVIARYSYGVYLLHVPVLYFSFHYLKGIPSIASWAIFSCSLTGLSYVAYHFIEKPGVELGHAVVDHLNAGRTRHG